MKDEGDGLGQSLWEDLLWMLRFRQARRMPVPWREPARHEALRVHDHPQMDRCGDVTVATTFFEGRRWIVMERLWHGWPDPPRYVLFVLEGETIWAARDFNHWPSAWRKPGADDHPTVGGPRLEAIDPAPRTIWE